MAELLPCPFCGGEPELDTVDQGCWRIGCDGCGYDLMTGGVGIGWYSSLSAAKVAWNTRAPLPRIAGRAQEQAMDSRKVQKPDGDLKAMVKWAVRQQMIELFAGKPKPMGWYLEDDRGEYLRSETRTEPDGQPAKWRTPNLAEANAKAAELNGGVDA